MADDTPSRDELLKRAGMPSGSDTVPSNADLLARTRASTVTQAPGRSAEELFGPSSLPTRQRGPGEIRLPGEAGGDTTTTATPGSARDIFETGVGQIGRAIGDLPRYAGDMLGNFFTALKGGALTPRTTPATPEGREAGGAFVGELGDIGMAASGGGAVSGPVETPRQAGQLTRGFGTPSPPISGGAFDPLRRPPPLGPQLALPPPAIAPAAPTRALPPPSVDLPGRAVPTGPGDIRPVGPAAGGGGFAYSPPPPTGQIPPRGATMRTQSGPQLGAPLSTTEQARLAGGVAGRDLPPRAPGTQGRPPSAALIDDAHIGQPSQVASALVTNDASAIDQAVTKRFQRAAPGGSRPQTRAQMETRDQHITTAVDSIIANKDNIQFRDPSDTTGGTLMKAGRLPRNLDEFVQSIDYLKGEIFKKYDQLTTMVGGQGVSINLAPTIARLRKLATDPAIEDITPGVRREAMEMADRFEQRGSYSPSEAQNVIQSMNAQLRNFLQKKQTGEIYSHPTLVNQVRDQLLNDLNSTMATALRGPQYQALRNQYASLSSIEGNVTNALVKQLEKPTGLFGGKKLTLAEMGGLIWGAVDFNPKVFGATAAVHLSRELQRYLSSPNFAVRRMFSSREAALQPSITDVASARIASLPNYRPPPLPPQPYVGPSGM